MNPEFCRVLHGIGEMGYGGAELLLKQLACNGQGRGVRATIVVIGFCDEQVAFELESAGVELIRFNAKLLSPANILRIRRLALGGDFDIVHVHLFPALYWAALAKPLRSGGRHWIYTEHSTSNRRRQYPLFRYLERFIYARYERVFCISESARASMQAWLPSLRNLGLILNGIDVARFRNASPMPRATIGMDENDRVILSVGAFRSEKNQAMLIRALAKLPEPYKLVLLGYGPELPKVQKLAADLGLSRRVYFAGGVADVERYMRMADIYVLPSHFEGFGISAIEAAAAGLPVLYSDVAGLNDIFAGVGQPISADDPDGTAVLIDRLCSDPAIAKETADRCVRLAEDYDVSRMISDYHEIYTNLLADT